MFPGGRTGKCCALLKDKKRRMTLAEVISDLLLVLGTMITDLGVAPDFRAGPERGEQMREYDALGSCSFIRDSD